MDRQTHRECHLVTGAELGVMPLRAKERQGLPVATDIRKDRKLEFSERIWSFSHLDLRHPASRTLRK